MQLHRKLTQVKMKKNNGIEDKGVFDGMGPWDANNDGKVDEVDDMIIDYSMFGDEGEPERRPMKNNKKRSASDKRWLVKILVSFFFGLLPTLIMLIYVMSLY